jgi:hypothetical protein
MRSKILVVGFALISVFAVAQSSNTKTDAAASSDTKQGQAKLKMTPEKVEAGSENIKKNGGVVIKPTSASPMAADDWQQRNASGSGNGSTSNTASTSSDVKAPRDVATGQASGKRQHQPVTLKQEDEQKTTNPKK